MIGVKTDLSQDTAENFAICPKFWAQASMDGTVEKLAGLVQDWTALLFLLPLTQIFVDLKYSAVVVCTIATFSAIQEGYLIRTGREIT